MKILKQSINNTICSCVDGLAVAICSPMHAEGGLSVHDTADSLVLDTAGSLVHDTAGSLVHDTAGSLVLDRPGSPVHGMSLSLVVGEDCSAISDMS